MKEEKASKIGGVMGVVSTLVGLIVSFYMMDLQSNIIEFVTQTSIILGVLTAFIVSYFLGGIGAHKIMIENKNFVRIWSWYGFVTVICAETVGFFIHIVFVNPYVDGDLIFFLFVITAFYSAFFVVIFGSVLGYIVKYLGEQINDNEL